MQIYTHDNVKQTLSSGKMPIERLPVNIGKNVYVGPNSIITKNVTVGDFCVIAASSFINKISRLIQSLWDNLVKLQALWNLTTAYLNLNIILNGER
ncbi:MAG: hypothetical protein IPH34_09110 [Chitinophagaceae bacterium]|nr:hypothetical protein [Chitinophagaceae bacterium]